MSYQQQLELLETFRAIPDRPRCGVPLQAECCQYPGDFADVPFDRVDPERAIGDVGDAKVLSAWQQVLDPHGDHRAERDLEWPAAEIEVAGSADPGMQVDPVAADPHRVAE